MKLPLPQAASVWRQIGPALMPFADACTETMPLSRLLRLGLFQISAGMVIVLLNGTLNRVMIVELGVPATLVALMIALPLLLAPARVLIGFRSDHHRSYLGWRRIPYVAIGSMLQFGGLAILPMAIILLSGDSTGPAWLGHAATILSFLLIGAGLHTAQTAGLALATDVVPAASRARVVALLYIMLLVGMVVSSIAYALLLENFSQIRLIQVLQGAAVVTLLLNLIALWRQEVRQKSLTRHDLPTPDFRASWRRYMDDPRSRRYLCALGLGTAAFSMQDILLEPFGAQVLQLGVSATTLLTAILTFGTLLGFLIAARQLSRGADAYRLSAYGVTLGTFAFAAIIFASPLTSLNLFCFGVLLIGISVGLFSVGMLSAAMSRADESSAGLALGAWGAVQATAAGVAIFVGGAIRDMVSQQAEQGYWGSTLTDVSTGYLTVFMLELVLLFAALVVLGPLVGTVRKTVVSTDKSHRGVDTAKPEQNFGLTAFPG